MTELTQQIEPIYQELLKEEEVELLIKSRRQR